MSEVTQRICDGCGVAGKKGEPAHEMVVGVSRNGDAPKVHKYDLHADSKCVKALYRKLSGEAEELLQETLEGASVSD